MLPDVRFVFGALMVLAVTGMIGVGLFVSARLLQQMGPIESGRTLAFTDSAEWNQFRDAGSVRRYVGLSRRGEPREIPELPADQHSQQSAPAEMSSPERQAATAALSPEPAPSATAATDVASSAERISTIAAPALPDQVHETPSGEGAIVVDAATAAPPGPAETVVAPAASTPVGIEPPAAEERPPDRARLLETPRVSSPARAVDPENRYRREQPDEMPAAIGDVSDPTAVTGTIDAAHKGPAEPAPPLDAVHPPAAPAKAVARPARTPPKRTARNDDDERRSPAASRPRPRTPASRPATAGQAYAAGQDTGAPWVDPRQPPTGQPVFGPNFPYATPGSSQPHFGPYFPYATPQASRRAAARAVRPLSPHPRLPQPSPQSAYSYGWR